MPVPYPTNVAERHPSTQQVMRWLEVNPKLPDQQRFLANDVRELAEDMLQRCPDSPELTTGLRKLLEAKDCFVRASFDAEYRGGPDDAR